ncbi:MAG: signal peptidase I [Alphaproteobacteria bacterium]|nr:signal peptidase I [Alphaproteobacteria bacterium]
MKAKLFKLGLGLGTLFLLCWVVTFYTKLALCASDSLKGIHYALFLKSASINRGDIVLIPNYPVPYVGEKSLSKRVFGLPGDRISRDKEGIKIASQDPDLKNSNPKHLPLLEKTSKGEPLTPLSERVIPAGYVFVAGDNTRSFDSRYEEFGLVPIEKIWGKALAVFSAQDPVFKWGSQIWEPNNEGDKLRPLVSSSLF